MMMINDIMIYLHNGNKKFPNLRKIYQTKLCKIIKRSIMWSDIVTTYVLLHQDMNFSRKFVILVCITFEIRVYLQIIDSITPAEKQIWVTIWENTFTHCCIITIVDDYIDYFGRTDSRNKSNKMYRSKVLDLFASTCLCQDTAIILRYICKKMLLVQRSQ